MWLEGSECLKELGKSDKGADDRVKGCQVLRVGKKTRRMYYR